MGDVSLARAPRWSQWIFFGLVFLLAKRPVLMTAGRRDSLQNNSDSLDLAMEEIERLRKLLPQEDEVVELDQKDERL